MNEIKILKLFNSENIIKFLDFKDDSQEYNILLEYANGGDLLKKLK